MAAVVNPELPVKSVEELVALVKAKPGALSWTSAGNGSTGHLTLELFKASTGVDVTHVPYKGTQPAFDQIVLGGRVPVMFDGVVTSLPHIKSGKVAATCRRQPHAIAVATRCTHDDEAGLPGFEAVGLADVFAPAGTPPEIVAKVSADIAAVLKEPEVRDKLAGMGLEVVGSSPTEFSRYVKSESEKWGKVIRDAGVKAE